MKRTKTRAEQLSAIMTLKQHRPGARARNLSNRFRPITASGSGMGYELRSVGIASMVSNMEGKA